ncbi:Immunoglobulin I-set [Trinorchestia longiramus]|nr:Immunoglobulin I-set [Trinorchestia longiramus]
MSEARPNSTEAMAESTRVEHSTTEIWAKIKRAECHSAELGRLVSESACERKYPGSNPAADMVDAARNTAWDLGKQPNNYRSNYPIQEWARRWKCQNATLSKPRTGRPRKINDRAVRKLVRTVVQRPQTTREELKDDLKASKIEASKYTISSALRRERFPSCTPRGTPFLQKSHVKAKLKCANDHLNKPAAFWNSVLWSDEIKIELFGRNSTNHVWRQQNEEYKLKCTVKFGGGLIMVWGCSSSSGVGGKPRDPVFLGDIGNQTVPEGRTVRFACRVDYLGPHKLAWIYYENSAILTVANHVITRNDRISVTHDKHQKTWYLHIADVRESDTGKYMCQINTASTMTVVGYLTVVVPPDIVDSESSGDVIAQEGNDVKLRCKARGSPKPVVTWKREDGQLITVNKTLSGKCSFLI